MAKPIGTLGTVDTLTVAGRVYTDLTTIIGLTAICSGAVGTSSPRAHNATTGYAPSGANRFIITSVEAVVGAAGAINIGYANNDCGFNSNTSPTAPVYWKSGDTNNVGSVMGPNQIVKFDVNNFEIPNGKFALFFGDGVTVASVIIYGYEAP